MKVTPYVRPFARPIALGPRQLAALFAVLTAPLGVALAAPPEGVRQHFQAIGSGDVAAISQAYGEHAQLSWIGGPHDGTYRGADQIKGMWEKFTSAHGKLQVAVARIEESTNASGSTVTANVQLRGRQRRFKLRCVLTYRDGRIMAESWQVDPTLSM